MHDQPHEKFAPSRGLRFPYRASAGEYLVSREEQLVGTACGEAAITRMAPDQGISHAIREMHLMQLVPQVKILAERGCGHPASDVLDPAITAQPLRDGDARVSLTKEARMG